jgi:hypothetical protein
LDWDSFCEAAREACSQRYCENHQKISLITSAPEIVSRCNNREVLLN